MFIIWKEIAWRYDTPDHTGMLQLAKKMVRLIPMEPDGSGENGHKDKLNWAIRSENGPRFREAINLVKAEGQTTISIADLNKDPYLFNCRNATLDLRTGEARAHSRNDLITIIAPVDYDKDATCSKWLYFMGTVRAGNQENIAYLQTLGGYCLTGDTA